MTTMDNSTGAGMSRRGLMQTIIVGGATIATAGLAQAAPLKVKPTTVSYQPTPKGRARCDNCAKWLPPNACKTVDGVISPSGWCNVYAPKA